MTAIDEAMLQRAVELGNAQLGRGQTAATTNGHGWDDPMPLPGGAVVPVFDPNWLGEPAGAFVRSVAAETKTPVDLAGIGVLGACSALISGGLVVSPHDGWRQPTNLYLQVLVPSGEGKSPVMRRITEPVDLIERARQEAVAPTLIEAGSRQRIAQKRLTDAEHAAAKATGDERTNAEREAAEAARELAGIELPMKPRLYTRDSTPEGLQKLLTEQRGQVAVLSDEGAEFFEMASRYSSTGKGNLGVYLAGADGNRFVSDRANREMQVIERVTLTVLLFTQTAVLDDLGHDRQAAGRGLYARFLWVIPQSMVGSRSVEPRPAPEPVVMAFEGLMVKLAGEAAGYAEDPLVARLSPEAAAMFQAWQSSHEPRLGPGGDLAGIVEWANKLPGHVLRLAGNLHALQVGTIHGGVVIEETMAAALRLGDYFTAHALNAFGVMGSGGAAKDAGDILKWLEARAVSEVKTRDIYRSKSWEPDRTAKAMELLERYGWIRAVAPTGDPGRPAVEWEIHPKVADKTRHKGGSVRLWQANSGISAETAHLAASESAANGKTAQLTVRAVPTVSPIEPFRPTEAQRQNARVFRTEWWSKQPDPWNFEQLKLAVRSRFPNPKLAAYVEERTREGAPE